jgi:hypothetical protein
MATPWGFRSPTHDSDCHQRPVAVAMPAVRMMQVPRTGTCNEEPKHTIMDVLSSFRSLPCATLQLLLTGVLGGKLSDR